MKRHPGLLFIICYLLFSPAATLWAQGPNGSAKYYSAADGKCGAELKTALCSIISTGTVKRTYAQLWNDFKKTDKRADGKVWDMYSNATNFTFGTNQDKGSHPEEGYSYNREHSFPNSWWGGTDDEAQYTDLFHLYPTDAFVNEKRSNYPFGETKGNKYKSNDGFSKLGTCTTAGYTGVVFEPNDEYKGDFARTYFYMVTRYEEQITLWKGASHTLDGNKYPGLKKWQLDMLLRWSEQDPVSEKEINRNKAVYGIQKNRNPFIDYPGLERFIWGDKTDVPFDYTGLRFFMAGDINDDGLVDVSDYIGVANYILGQTQEGFNEQAADVNNDGNIDVSDYIGIANIILTGSIYGNSTSNPE